MMAFVKRDDLQSLMPVTDQVYRDGDIHVKVRVIRMPIDGDEEARRSCRAFKISAALCNADGYALQAENAEGEYLIAPAETLTVQLQGAFDKAEAENKTVVEVIEASIQEKRDRLLKQAVAFKQALLLDDVYPTAVPSVVN